MTAKSRSALTTEVSSQITSQTTANAITPTVEGAVFQDIVDSGLNPLSDISNPGIPANGQLLIGNGTNYSLATITAGTNVTVTNGSGTITIAATGGSGGSGTVNSATANQAAYYSTTGTAVSGNANLIFGTNLIYYGPNGSTNPALTVDGSTASMVNGLKITGAATGAGNFVNLQPAGADANINVALQSLGTGIVYLNASTGGSTVVQYNGIAKITVSGNVTIASGAVLTVQGAQTTAGVATFNGIMTNTSGTNKPTRAVTTATTTTTADYAVFANGTFTITLHTPTAGQLLNIKNTGAGTITLSGTTDLGSSTIAAGVNVSLIYDIAAATWRGQ